jgi:hypothetical protein
MLEGRTRQALETLAPMQDADGSPQRLKVNPGILYAASGNAERSRQLLDGRVSDGDLSALTPGAGDVGEVTAAVVSVAWWRIRP